MQIGDLYRNNYASIDEICKKLNTIGIQQVDNKYCNELMRNDPKVFMSTPWFTTSKHLDRGIIQIGVWRISSEIFHWNYRTNRWEENIIKFNHGPFSRPGMIERQIPGIDKSEYEDVTFITATPTTIIKRYSPNSKADEIAKDIKQFLQPAINAADVMIKIFNTQSVQNMLKLKQLNSADEIWSIFTEIGMPNSAISYDLIGDLAHFISVNRKKMI